MDYGKPENCKMVTDIAKAVSRHTRFSWHEVVGNIYSFNEIDIILCGIEYADMHNMCLYDSVSILISCRDKMAASSCPQSAIMAIHTNTEFGGMRPKTGD